MASLLHGLTLTERSVMICTARLLTFLQYQAENADIDEMEFARQICVELTTISKLVADDPTTVASKPRYHPVVLIVGKLWRALAEKKEILRAEQISLPFIERTCVKMRQVHGDYPPVLTSMDLKELNDEMSPGGSWWLPRRQERQVDDGAVVVRRSERANKGKAPLRADSDMEVDPEPPRQRGIKRSAATAARAEAEVLAEEDEGDTTPRKSGHVAQPRHVTVDVVVSPRAGPPKRRRRGSKGDADESNEVQVADVEGAESEDEVDELAEDLAVQPAAQPLEQLAEMPAGELAEDPIEVEDEESAGDVSEGEDENIPSWVFVGKDSDRCELCTRRGRLTCVPQWDATRVSSACKYCARCKKVCKPTDTWRNMVAKQAPKDIIPTIRVRGGKAPVPAPERSAADIASTSRAAAATNVPASLQEHMAGMEARMSAHLMDVKAHFNVQMSEQKSRLSALEVGLTRLAATQLELKALLLGLSGRSLGPSAAASAAASTATSAASSPAAALGNLRIGDVPPGMSAPSPAQSSNASENTGRASKSARSARSGSRSVSKSKQRD